MARSSATSPRTGRPTSRRCCYQNGAQPFTYDPANKGEIGIKLNDDASKKVLDYWAGLVKKGLVGGQDQFTPEYIAGVIGGKRRHVPVGRVGTWATCRVRAWARVPTRRCGPRPRCRSGTRPTRWSVNWGGSAFSVTTQAKDPALAAKVAFGVYADDAVAQAIGRTRKQIIFPLNLKVLKDPEFIDAKIAFFGGQQANKGGLRPGGQRLQRALPRRRSTRASTRLHEADRRDQRRVQDRVRSRGRALQEDVVKYAKEQGLTVKDLKLAGRSVVHAGRPNALPRRPGDTTLTASTTACPRRRPRPSQSTVTASTAPARTTTHQRTNARYNVAGWLFVGQFGIVFLALAPAPRSATRST